MIFTNTENSNQGSTKQKLSPLNRLPSRKSDLKENHADSVISFEYLGIVGNFIIKAINDNLDISLKISDYLLVN